MLELVGLLEAAEIARQRRRGVDRSLVTAGSDRDPASVRLLALTWWPAGIALRQWAIATLGWCFVGHVLVLPGQTVIGTGPYRWLRHPSYAPFIPWRSPGCPARTRPRVPG
jgi:hypothetical protein